MCMHRSEARKTSPLIQPIYNYTPTEQLTLRKLQMPSRDTRSSNTFASCQYHTMEAQPRSRRHYNHISTAEQQCCWLLSFRLPPYEKHSIAANTHCNDRLRKIFLHVVLVAVQCVTYTNTTMCSVTYGCDIQIPSASLRCAEYVD
jgi:hypothetical protein